MSSEQAEKDLTVTLVLSEENMEKLQACAEYRGLSVEDVVRLYVQDWIDTDYSTSQGAISRRMLYRDYPDNMNARD